jgi:hypothetical protein
VQCHLGAHAVHLNADALAVFAHRYAWCLGLPAIAGGQPAEMIHRLARALAAGAAAAGDVDWLGGVLALMFPAADTVRLCTVD